MRKAHRRIRRVDALTAGASCAHNVNAHVSVFYFNFRLFGFRQNRNRYR